MMYRLSNSVIGCLNLLTLLASIPIIGAGLWMARSSKTCEHFLQTPLLVIGFVVLVVSLAGFVGACFHVACALWIYLAVMLFLIAALAGLTLFGLAVTSKGGGVEVPDRAYKEYHLQDYSPWLVKRIRDPRYWNTIRSCIMSSKTCDKLQSWTPDDYMQRDLTPIQSGCCKPPTACNYNTATTTAPQDSDCFQWNNAPTLLCYDCDSCKAGVLQDMKREWHKLVILNVIVLVFLILIYLVGCCAFRNARADYSYPYGLTRMTKVRRRWDPYW